MLGLWVWFLRLFMMVDVMFLGKKEVSFPLFPSFTLVVIEEVNMVSLRRKQTPTNLVLK